MKPGASQVGSLVQWALELPAPTTLELLPLAGAVAMEGTGMRFRASAWAKGERARTVQRVSDEGVIMVVVLG